MQTPRAKSRGGGYDDARSNMSRRSEYDKPDSPYRP